MNRYDVFSSMGLVGLLVAWAVLGNGPAIFMTVAAILSHLRAMSLYYKWGE